MELNGLKTSSYVYPGKTLVVNEMIGGTHDNTDTVDNASNTATNDPVTVSNTTVAATSDSDDLYGNQQAPVIVQDETNGVKQYDPSQSTDQVSVNVSSNDNIQSVSTPAASTTTNSAQYGNSAATQAASQSPQSVTVQSGDTLDGIANQAGTTIDHLKQLNNLNSNLLVVGQTLKL
jgi:LysM repeat protein